MSKNSHRLADLKIDRAQAPRQRPWGWIALIAIALTLLVGAVWWSRLPDAPEVTTVAAQATTASSSKTVLNASGYVTARRQATVSSKVTGKVVEVSIEEGMEVEEGRILARLDDANVRRNLELAQAQSRAAASALAETRVRVDEAELNLERTQSLVDQAIASQAALDRDRAAMDALAARLRQQQDEVAVAERQVSLWRQQLEDSVIRAPFAGVIVSKDAQPGEMISPVSAGGGFTRTGIGTIVDMNSLEIEVDVNESYINRVLPDQAVEATLDAYTDWQIPAHVIAIIPTADRQRATVKVRIGFEQLDPKILPDMGVKVAFLEAEESAPQQNAVSIPLDALDTSGENNAVWVVQGGKVERRAVRTGASSGEQVTIVAGIAAGERVVVDPDKELVDGGKIKESLP